MLRHFEGMLRYLSMCMSAMSAVTCNACHGDNAAAEPKQCIQAAINAAPRTAQPAAAGTGARSRRAAGERGRVGRRQPRARHVEQPAPKVLCHDAKAVGARVELREELVGAQRAGAHVAANV